MKAVIVYFSQTGNTRKIARAIQTGIGQVLGQCDIATLKETDPAGLSKYDLIGLGAPVWSSREPPNVTEFIKRMGSLKGKHVFPFSSHGSLPSGFMQSVVPALKKKGLLVVGYNDWYGGCIWQALPIPYLTDLHPDAIDIKEAKEFGADMARLSQRIYKGETQLIPRLPTMKEWHERYNGRPVKISNELNVVSAAIIKGRKINEEKCTECGLCVANCPADSIDFSTSPPSFKGNCLGCHFCEQICPTGAIEVNWDLVAKLHDKYIKILLGKRLDKAELSGRFRRLVPKEAIGWNTHWYEITGHPRYKIEK
jgi:flavodoxin/NAD-dependent dihydropyrimidine dehydrogenase PreA subunit